MVSVDGGDLERPGEIAPKRFTTKNNKVGEKMFIKLSSRTAPILLLILSALWMAWGVFPLFYSLLFPNADIKHIVRALEGSETLSGDVGRLVEQITSSVGQLKRAIQITAYSSVEYKLVEPRTTKTTQVSYLAWFKKQSKPMIFVVTRTEVDGSSVRIRTDEGSLFGVLEVYLPPALLVALSLYWFRRRRSFDAAINARGSS